MPEISAASYFLLGCSWSAALASLFKGLLAHWNRIARGKPFFGPRIDRAQRARRGPTGAHSSRAACSLRPPLAAALVRHRARPAVLRRAGADFRPRGLRAELRRRAGVRGMVRLPGDGARTRDRRNHGVPRGAVLPAAPVLPAGSAGGGTHAARIRTHGGADTAHRGRGILLRELPPRARARRRRRIPGHRGRVRFLGQHLHPDAHAARFQAAVVAARPARRLVHRADRLHPDVAHGARPDELGAGEPPRPGSTSHRSTSMPSRTPRATRWFSAPRGSPT